MIYILADMKPVYRFLAWSFNRHCYGHHNASYDVCYDPWCWLGWWLGVLLKVDE